jgi:uncharacterized protein
MDTPCVNICVLDEASGLCAGCGRSLAEIVAWPHMSSAERRRIMRELARRMPKRSDTENTWPGSR